VVHELHNKHRFGSFLFTRHSTHYLKILSNSTQKSDQNDMDHDYILNRAIHASLYRSDAWMAELGESSHLFNKITAQMNDALPFLELFAKHLASNVHK
jgi:hypothetical protein